MIKECQKCHGSGKIWGFTNDGEHTSTECDECTNAQKVKRKLKWRPPKPNDIIDEITTQIAQRAADYIDNQLIKVLNPPVKTKEKVKKALKWKPQPTIIEMIEAMKKELSRPMSAKPNNLIIGEKQLKQLQQVFPPKKKS